MKLNVPYIRQTGPLDCWHAAIRMIYAYKKQMSPNPAPSLYQADAGLSQDCASVAAMAKDSGMKAVPIQPVNEQQLEATLRTYGPLWLPLNDVSGANGAHVVVITGVENGTIYINDPAWLTNPSQENKKARNMLWFNRYFARAAGLLYLP